MIHIGYRILGSECTTQHSTLLYYSAAIKIAKVCSNGLIGLVVGRAMQTISDTIFKHPQQQQWKESQSRYIFE